MINPVPLQIALANVHPAVDADELYRFIESHSDNVHTYWIDPTKARGRHVRASVEYIVVLLGAIGSVASIASLLWQAYDKFIVQKKCNNNTAGLNISIEFPDRTRYNFWLGNEYKDRDIFIEEFSNKVEMLQADPNGEIKAVEVLSSIIHEDLWTRRK